MNSRDAALVAEAAWNKSKGAEDPDFKGASLEHQLRLQSLVNTIEAYVESGRSGESPTGVVGLEAFEEAVVSELVAPPKQLEPPKPSPKPKGKN